MALPLLAFPAAAQTRFTTAELRQDFSLLRSALIEAHAGLYVYQSPRAVSRLFDSAAATIRDTTMIGFYDTVSRVLAQRPGPAGPGPLPPAGTFRRWIPPSPSSAPSPSAIS